MKWFVVVCMLLFPSMLYAQKPRQALIDSCIGALPSVTVDSAKVKLLDTISSLLYSIDPDKGIKYGNEGLELADQLNWAKGKAKANNSLGQNYLAKTDYPRSLDYFLKALKAYEELNDTKSAAIINDNIANVYLSLENYSKALEYDSASLNYAVKLRDEKLEAQVLGNMGVIYDDQLNMNKALEFYQKANVINEKIDNKSELAKNLGNIGTVYFSQKKYGEALDNVNQAIKIYEQIGEKHSLALNYFNAGEFYLEIAQDTTGDVKRDLIIPAGKTGNLNKALEYLNRSKNVAWEIGYLEALMQCDNSLSQTYSLLGNFKEALHYFKEYNILHDSINVAEAKVKVTKLEAQSREQIKDKDIRIRELKKSREQIIYISGIVVLLIVIGIVGRNFLTEIKSNRKLAKERKKHIERIRAQKNALMDIAYIQSHEVRGPISTILGLVQLFNYEDLSDPNNRELMEGIATVTQRLDKVVTDVVKKENKLSNETDADNEEENDGDEAA